MGFQTRSYIWKKIIKKRKAFPVNNLLFDFCTFLFPAVWVLALTGNIVLCSWVRHLTLTVPEYPLRCINRYLLGGNPAIVMHPIQRGWGEGEVEILLVASCYRNWNECWPDGQLGTYADLTSTVWVAVCRTSAWAKHFTWKSLDSAIHTWAAQGAFD